MATKVVIVGAGGLGSYAVDEFLKHKYEFNLVVLSRKENKALSDKGATVAVVDFHSVEQLSTALKGASVLISFVFSRDKNEFLTIHRNLIKACKATGVNRFIPSEWAADPEIIIPLDLYAPKYEFRKDIESSGLEYSLVGNGLFMDYLLPKGAKKYAKDVVIPVNSETRTASIPGTGNEPLTVTTCEDIARSVVELVRHKERLPKHFRIAGEKTSWNKILATAEKVIGQKFTVQYRSEKELQEIIDSSEDPYQKFYAQVDMIYAKGQMAETANTESEPILKNIKFTSVEELLRNNYSVRKT